MTTPFDHKVWSQPRWLHYGVGVLLAIAGIALRVELTPILGDRSAYAVVLIPVAVAAYAGGFWPGMLTMVIGISGAVSFIVLPGRVDGELALVDLIQLSFTVTICLFINVIAERLRRSAMRNSRLNAQMTLETAQVRNVLESITDAFTAVGPDWKMVQANPAFLSSFCHDGAAADGSLWDCIPREGSSELAGELLRAMRDQTTRHTEWQDPRTKDWYHVRAFPSPLALSVFFHNITSRKQLDESRDRMLDDARKARLAAEEASRLKEEFLATVSHELRTPMTALIGWSEILSGPKVSEERLREGLGIIEQSAKAQAKLVDELLDISRITSGKLKVDLSFWPLVDLVEEAVRVHSPAAHAKGITLEFQGDEECSVVQADGIRIHQVLSNVISNAIKFTPQGGEITISLSSTDGFASVIVIDNGEGISADFLPNVFDRFRQANATTTRRHGGLGLGLAISKELVELHGGTIEVSSDGQGLGTRVNIRLPKARTWTQRLQFGTGDVARANLKGHRILVIEDDDSSRLLITRLLEDHGAVVVAASNASDGIQQIPIHQPHVIISDIGMPGVDGYDLARMIRTRDDEWATVPLLALTAFAKERDRATAHEAGFNDLITKPIDSALLLNTVSNLVEINEETGHLSR